jgi:hypothetical protein
MTRITHLFFISFALLAFSFFTSCSKTEATPETDSYIENEPTSELQMSEEEVAEIIEASLSQSKGGMTKEMESTTEDIETMALNELCDSILSDTRIFEYNGLQIQASSEASWTFDLNCTPFGLPQSAIISIESAISFNSPRISSEGTSTFTGDIAGLQFSSPSIIWNGTYSRTGSYDFNFQQSNNGYSTIDLALTAVTLNKQSLIISSGSGIFTIEITSNDNTSTIEGTITFNGDQTATLVINGMEFIIDLS